ncbi:unnamed protein product [Protopolystoma xenopodis]|uniref:Uncharacterized protein n=1 Tax=Protopolystoma xenopodis TaxID=117903 RepID=A0A3S4ZF62_9PLAT|nr:unnamed protein product [Protopolystoma xenopodis]
MGRGSRRLKVLVCNAILHCFHSPVITRPVAWPSPTNPVGFPPPSNSHQFGVEMQFFKPSPQAIVPCYLAHIHVLLLLSLVFHRNPNAGLEAADLIKPVFLVHYCTLVG